jgi:hypothetical protein
MIKPWSHTSMQGVKAHCVKASVRNARGLLRKSVIASLATERSLGYCSQCPDNAYCEGGRPKSRPAPERPANPKRKPGSLLKRVEGRTNRSDTRSTHQGADIYPTGGCRTRRIAAATHAYCIVGNSVGVGELTGGRSHCQRHRDAAARPGVASPPYIRSVRGFPHRRQCLIARRYVNLAANAA